MRQGKLLVKLKRLRMKNKDQNNFAWRKRIGQTFKDRMKILADMRRENSSSQQNKTK